MLTIPPGSRIDAPLCAENTTLTITSSDEATDTLALVATTQTYLACLVAETTPGADQVGAWDAFYDCYKPIVGQAACHQKRDHATTFGDDTQEIWLAVLERLDTFQVDAGLGSFPAWLRTVARRRLADGRRSRRRRPIPSTWGAPPQNLVGPEADPARACEQAEDRAWLTSLLERLRGEVSPLSYQVLHLRSIEERTVAEVGRLVGLSAEQVRNRHSRMLSRLRVLAGMPPATSPAKKSRKSSATRAMPRPLATCM